MRDLAGFTAAFPAVFRLRRPERDDELAGLLRLAEGRDELDGGFRYRFTRDAGMLRSIAWVIEAEFRARPELHFALFVEAGRGPMWLAITGPEGTQGLLDSIA